MIEAPQTILIPLLADVTSSSTSFGSVTGLSFNLGAREKWKVDGSIVHQADATTTGLNLGFTDPTGCTTSMLWHGPISVSAGAFRHNVADDTGTAQTGTPAANTNTQNTLDATVINGSTAGTWQLRFASEVGGSVVTIKAGSYLRITRLP